MSGKLKNENCKLKIANWGQRVAPPSSLARFRADLKFSIYNLQFSIPLLLLALVTATAVAAEPPANLAPPGLESWPTFRNGPQQLGVATTKLPKKLELRWTHPAGKKDGMIKSTAAIVGGRVYAASLNGEVFCLDLKTGERQWTYKSRQVENPNAFIPGFKAAVAVTADAV
jgi:outer membrane protein assembly factor BamB